MAPISVDLSTGSKAVLRELKVSEAIAVLDALEQSEKGLDEFIFVCTDELIPLMGDSMLLANTTVGDLTFSDLDAIAVAFTQVNKSFLARVIAKRKPRGDPIPGLGISQSLSLIDPPDPNLNNQPTSIEPVLSSSNEAI